MNKKVKFLGRGWSFPPEFDHSTKQVDMFENELDIKSSLEILLSTGMRERIMRPDFGCDLTPMLFEPLTTSLRTFISDRIKTAILYHEPRIDVEQIQMNQDEILEGKILIEVNFKVRSTNSRHNFVFPFYKEEGTEVS